MLIVNLGPLHYADMSSVANVSEVHIASLFWNKASRVSLSLVCENFLQQTHR